MLKKSTLYKKLILVVVVVITTFVILLIGLNNLVSEKSKPYLLDKENINVTCKTGLVLGTSRYLISGGTNPYFKYRIEAASDLIKNHNIEFIIVSGDNRTKAYNEPKVMRKALIEKGVSSKRIVMDYAGLRTLDSVIRTKKVFGQERFIIISQKFHVERAVYIARYHGIEAYGYIADDVPISKDYYTHLREVFARAKMFLDLYILKTSPKHLGKEEIIK
ncbi:hypothetical protein EI427_11560 [Flammeovirga pectinis]|uniref:DUF218 domain-containing protein n=1 Tax=Flammeovirga pectinis TaxID=2494373 RepID=A0A3S9P3R0_9BACT|nr:ElyC/SanA/YdcF family protein [Flammeovirga pectinis]AZQ62847.1 hypothetical protein EI427_11560 [Flammeovirga pectinis]